MCSRGLTSLLADVKSQEGCVVNTSIPGSAAFQGWYADFLEAVDFGGPREIFKNL